MPGGSRKKVFCELPVYIQETQPVTHDPIDVPMLVGHTLFVEKHFVQSFADPPEHSSQLDSHSIYIYIYIAYLDRDWN